MERRWRDKGRVRSENILEHPDTMHVCVRARVCVCVSWYERKGCDAAQGDSRV